MRRGHTNLGGQHLTLNLAVHELVSDYEQPNAAGQDAQHCVEEPTNAGLLRKNNLSVSAGLNSPPLVYILCYCLVHAVPLVSDSHPIVAAHTPD